MKKLFKSQASYEILDLLTKYSNKSFYLVEMSKKLTKDPANVTRELEKLIKNEIVIVKLKSSKNAVILITHYQRLLDYIVPDHVHVLYNGKIVKSGNKDLALELEAKGYDWIKEEVKN